jgi:hypothetical protein
VGGVLFARLHQNLDALVNLLFSRSLRMNEMIGLNHTRQA